MLPSRDPQRVSVESHHLGWAGTRCRSPSPSPSPSAPARDVWLRLERDPEARSMPRWLHAYNTTRSNLRGEGDAMGSRGTKPGTLPPLYALLLTLVFDRLLLCSGLHAVGGGGGPDFDPLIELPRPEAGFDARVDVSVDDFGAEGNGCTDDTQAFRDAWDFVCSAPSRATLEIPAGNVYLVRPINFTGPCNSKLTLLIMGTIVAPSDPDVWRELDHRRWLYFHRVNQLVVRGGGTIDGMGKKWWERSCKINATNPCRDAPKAITFHRTKHLTFKELTLVNSQQMHVAFSDCSHVKASHLRVIAPADSPNTDGIHISASTSVVVEDCIVRTGDDCISIVSNSSDVQIRNIRCGPGHGISIGSMGKYDSWDQVHKVVVDGAIISNTENGVRIKTWQGGSGYARNIVFRNVLMKDVSNPIIIDQYYCDSKVPCQNLTSAVKVDEISFINIKGTSATEEAISFACSDSYPCERIYLKDIGLSLASGGNATAYCWKASGFSSGLMHPPSCLDSGHLVKQNVPIQNEFL